MARNSRFLRIVRVGLTATLMMAAAASFAQTPQPDVSADEVARRQGLVAELLGNITAGDYPKVFERLKIEPPLEFQRCLCSHAGHTVGVGVQPEGAGACRFNGTGGTWKDVAPSDPNIWKACMLLVRYPDGRTVGDTLVAKLKEVADSLPWPAEPSGGVESGTIPLVDTPALLKSKLQQYWKMCLPTPAFSSEVLSDDVWKAFLRENVLDRAYRMISSAPNACEGAIETKLYLDSENGRHAAEIAWEAINSFVLMDKWTGAEVGADGALAKGYISGSPKPIIGLVGTFDNAADFIKVLEEEYKASKANADARAAFDTFHASAKWSTEKIQDQIRFLERSILADHASIAEAAMDLARQKERLLPTDSNGNRLTRTPETAGEIWNEYDRACEQLDRRTDLSVREARMRIVSARLQHKALAQYRLPLKERGCEAMMAEWKRACETKIGPVPSAQ